MAKVISALVALVLFLALCQNACASQLVIGGVGPFGVKFWAGDSPYQTMTAASPVNSADVHGAYTVNKLTFGAGSSVIFVRYQNAVGLDQQLILGQMFPTTGPQATSQQTIDGQTGFVAGGHSSLAGSWIDIGAYKFDAQTVVMLMIVNNQQYFQQAISTIRVTSSGRVASAGERLQAIGNAYVEGGQQFSQTTKHAGEYGYNTGDDFGPGAGEND